jgi:predicted outer membrane protein
MRVFRVMMCVAMLTAPATAQQVRPGPQRAPARTEAPLVRFEMDSLRLPDFDIANYVGVSDTGLITHSIAIDSLGVVLGNLAALKATDASVRDYAKLLASTHTGRLAEATKLLVDQGMRLAPITPDAELARTRTMLAWLDNTPAGPAWDAAFLRFQIAHQQNEMRVLTVNTRARPPEIDKPMEIWVTMLAKQRDVARSVATTIGVPLAP